MKQRLYEILFIFAAGIIPLIVYLKEYLLPYEDMEWFPGGVGVQYDFFLYFKAAAVIITAALMVIALIWGNARKAKTGKASVDQAFSREGLRRFIPLMVYLLAVLLSGLFSAHRREAFAGTGDVFESVPVIAGYCVFCLYSYIVSDKNNAAYDKASGGGTREGRDFQRMLGGCALFAAIAALIAFGQFLNLDFFRTELGKRLITPPSFWGSLSSLRFTFTEHLSYGTFYNSNYMTQYFGFVIAVSLSICLFGGVLRRARIFCALLSVMSFFALLGGYSKTGLAALLITLAAGAFVCAFSDKRVRRPVILSGAVIILGVVALYGLRFEGFGNLVRRFTTDAGGSERLIASIAAGEENATLYSRDGAALVLDYTLVEESGTALIGIHDGSGNEIPHVMNAEGTAYEVSEGVFKGSLISPRQIETAEGLLTGIVAYVDGVEWVFIDNGTYYYLNPAGKLVKPEAPKELRLFDEELFSGRGNIWNHILPLLKNTVLLGYGANTFVFAYPQNDYVRKAYEHQPDMIDVRAHSMYFQQLLENGFISLVAYLIFVFSYLICSFKIFIRKRPEGFEEALGFGIFCGVIWYLLSGITNDSNVNTAPVFWILLGMGMAINKKIKGLQR